MQSQEVAHVTITQLVQLISLYYFIGYLHNYLSSLHFLLTNITYISAYKQFFKTLLCFKSVKHTNRQIEEVSL